MARIVEDKIIVPINYLRCFNANIQSLMDELQRLEYVRDDLQGKVEAAQDDPRTILREVEFWLTKADEIQEDAEKFITGIQIPSCFSIRSRYFLSKKAKMKAEAMAELRYRCTFGDRSAFRSHKQIEDDILKALKDEATMIGTCGMGGIGKTTMARRILNRARDENLVTEAVMVVVGPSINMFRLQSQIAEMLGLKEMRSLETLEARAHMLHGRTHGKRILIVLDDIRTEIKLEDLGISGCRILLTSRNKDVLNRMGGVIFTMDVLSEEEAWSLFRDTTGSEVDDEDLVSIAKQVAKECKGLPLAIVAFGSIMKGRSKLCWMDALERIKSLKPNHSVELRNVYSPLRVSYEFLEDQEARSLFLLCSLFPDHSNIDLEVLTWYVVGLDMCEGIGSLEAAKYRVLRIVDTLKKHNLLLDGEDEYHLKMHDLIRHVAILIASEEGKFDVDHMRRGSSSCEWISSSNGSSEQLMGSNFPNLRLLLTCFDESKQFKVDDFSFLKGMERLNVLSFTSLNCEQISKAMQMLKYLRTLQLRYCNLSSISVVGEFLSLEILVCIGCDQIEELPVEIGLLKKLKFLNVSQCQRLKRIAPGVISNLVELEELRMVESFKKWETINVNETKRKNASLKELESLSKLRRLEIQMKDCTMVGLDKSADLESFQVPKRRVLRAADVHKSRHLIIDGEVRYHLKMNDVIGNAASFIASEEEITSDNQVPRRYVSTDNGKRSVFQTRSTGSPEQFVGAEFPNLRLFLVHFSRGTNITVDDLSSLEGIECLNGLSFRSLHWEKLPRSLLLPQNLRTLQLLNCNFNSISIISELLSLEILICVGCNQIEEFPNEMGKLKQLKLLTISQCRRLKRVAPGVISNLVELEELRMVESFNEWETTNVNETERNNASIIELESLSKLRLLEIQMKDRTMVGLDMPADLESFQVPKRRVLRAADIRKSRHLILDGEDRYYPKMSDFICNAASSIASEEGITEDNHEPRKYISTNSGKSSVFQTRSNESSEQFVGSKFPNLRLFLVHFSRGTNSIVNDLSSLHGIECLNGLSFRSLHWEKLPQSLLLPQYLQTLELLHCNFNSISIISELLSLEILICVGCNQIEEFPNEMGKLKRLKLLTISQCRRLKRIDAGVLSNLVEMAELRIIDSFNEWQSTNVNEEGRKNASLVELESLFKLKYLEIQIRDDTLVTEGVHVPSNVGTYRFSIGDGESVEDSFTWKWLKQNKTHLFPNYDSLP